MMENVDYEEGTANLEEGDFLFVFSDGITDVTDISEEMFGEKRLIDLLIEANHNKQLPGEIINNIVDTCINFSGKAMLFDDITAVVLKRMQSQSIK